MEGGYTKYRMLEKEDKEVFDAALKQLTGVGYEPLIVSTQVVHGLNYKFVCNARVVYPDAIPYLAMITIYVPLPGEGEPVITSIEKID